MATGDNDDLVTHFCVKRPNETRLPGFGNGCFVSQRFGNVSTLMLTSASSLTCSELLWHINQALTLQCEKTLLSSPKTIFQRWLCGQILDNSEIFVKRQQLLLAVVTSGECKMAVLNLRHHHPVGIGSVLNRSVLTDVRDWERSYCAKPLQLSSGHGTLHKHTHTLELNTSSSKTDMLIHTQSAYVCVCDLAQQHKNTPPQPPHVNKNNHNVTKTTSAFWPPSPPVLRFIFEAAPSVTNERRRSSKHSNKRRKKTNSCHIFPKALASGCARMSGEQNKDNFFSILDPFLFPFRAGEEAAGGTGRKTGQTHVVDEETLGVKSQRSQHFVRSRHPPPLPAGPPSQRGARSRVSGRS